MTGKTFALIVAAGRGSRAKRDDQAGPKQYVSLCGEAVLAHTIRRFLTCERVDQVLCVIHPDDAEDYSQAVNALAKADCQKLMPPIFGGETRQRSVYLGLEALVDCRPQNVLIHDGARPFASQALIDRVRQALEGQVGVVPSIPIADTVKRVRGDKVLETVDRAHLWGAQTPQGFHFDAIWSAHKAALTALDATFTDDASIAEWFNLDVGVIVGDQNNFKITMADDFDRGERFLSEGLTVRIGNGFDVHSFEEGTHITLCGVNLPFHKTLKGHSDADVALHAITDALYGALGAGDIGTHFPPSDPQWAGASSDIFLKHAVELVTKKGGRVSNVDVTLICEAPKIGPHVGVMKQAVADIMTLDIDQVSVKATTSEQLGFTGRGEGIAAMASACVML